MRFSEIILSWDTFVSNSYINGCTYFAPQLKYRLLHFNIFSRHNSIVHYIFSIFCIPSNYYDIIR